MLPFSDPDSCSSMSPILNPTVLSMLVGDSSRYVGSVRIVKVEVDGTPGKKSSIGCWRVPITASDGGDIWLDVVRFAESFGGLAKRDSGG